MDEKAVDGVIREASIVIPDRVLAWKPPEDRVHLLYAKSVLEGRIPAGRLAKLACLRSIRDHMGEGSLPHVYRPDRVQIVFDFIRHVPHTKGELADEGGTLELSAWQAWWIAELYGWFMRDNLKARRYQEAILETAKKSGKSTLLAALIIMELALGEQGGEIYSLAYHEDQAAIVYGMAEAAVALMRGNGGIQASLVHDIAGTGNRLACSETGAVYKALSGKSRGKDGLNPTLALFDESASILDRNLIEKMLSAQASRRSPLAVHITTAQDVTTTHYFEKRELLRNVLEGKIDAEEGESLFGIIYALDSEDELWDEGAWEKANPNLGISVNRRFLQRQARTIRTSPSQAATIKMHHFGLWQKSAQGWIPGTRWMQCEGEVQRTGDCFIGADLMLSRDLAAVARIWINHSRMWSIDVQCWTLENTIQRLPAHVRPFYQAARDRGSLVVQTGEVINLEEVEEYIRKSFRDYKVMRIGFDPYNAVQLASALEDERFPVLMVPQSISRLNDVRQTLETRVVNRQLVHDGDPFIRWQVENCVQSRRGNNYLHVSKPDGNEWAKIDAVAALVTAMAGVRVVSAGIEGFQIFKI